MLSLAWEAPWPEELVVEDILIVERVADDVVCLKMFLEIMVRNMSVMRERRREYKISKWTCGGIK